MNIQTITIRQEITRYYDFHAKIELKTQSERDEMRGFLNALAYVRDKMIPALENELKDIIQETEEQCITVEEYDEREKRMLRWLRRGPPECGDEWKS